MDASPAPDLRKPHPPSLSPRALAIAGWSAFLIAGLLFLGPAWNLNARSALVALDGRVAILLAVTQLHSPVALAALSVAFAAVLARLRQWYWVLTLAAAVGGGMLVNAVRAHESTGGAAAAPAGVDLPDRCRRDLRPGLGPRRRAARSGRLGARRLDALAPCAAPLDRAAGAREPHVQGDRPRGGEGAAQGGGAAAHDAGGSLRTEELLPRPDARAAR